MSGGLKKWVNEWSFWCNNASDNLDSGGRGRRFPYPSDNPQLISVEEFGDYRWNTISQWLAQATFWKQGFCSYKDVDKTLSETLTLSSVSVIWEEVKAFLGEKEVKRRLKEVKK